MCVGESDNEKMCCLEVRLVYAKHGMGEAWGKGVVDRKIQNEIKKKRTISMKQRQKGLKQQKKKRKSQTRKTEVDRVRNNKNGCRRCNNPVGRED